VLKRARASGAFRRILGTHDFLFARTWYDDEGAASRVDEFLMRYTVAVKDGALTVESLVQPKGAPSPIRIRYAVGETDGRLRSLESKFGYGGAVRAIVEDGELRVTARDGFDLSETEPLGSVDLVVPKVHGVFMLPMLFDQGLPERFSFRDLDPFGRLGRRAVFRRLLPGDPGATEGTVAWVTEEGNQRHTTRIQVVAAGEQIGRLLEIRTTSVRAQGRDEIPASIAISTRISAARYDALRAEYFGE
jgi:hypothetical protein